MKKYFLLSIVIIFAFTNVFSQKSCDHIEAMQGEVFREKGCVDLTYLGMDESGYYYLLDCGHTLIQKFDKNLNRVAFEKVSFTKDKVNKNRSLISIEYINNKIYVFSISQIKEKGNIISTLFAETLDKNTLQSNGDVTKVDDVTTKKIKEYSSFYIIPQPDSSKFLVAYSLPISDKEEVIRYKFLLYDKGFKQLWKQEKSLGYTADKFSVEDLDVDNNGVIVLTCKLSTESHMPDEKHLLVLTNNAAELKDYVLKPDGKQPSTNQTAFDKDGTIVCTGLYTEKGWDYGKGWYVMRVNPQTKEIITARSGAFDLSFINQSSGNKSVDEVKGIDPEDPSSELKRYRADIVRILDNGNIILVTEQVFGTKVEFVARGIMSDQEKAALGTLAYGKRGTAEYTVYHNNDIIIVCFYPDGSMNWVKRIPKYRDQAPDDLSFYIFCSFYNSLHVFYTYFPSSKVGDAEEIIPSTGKYPFKEYHVSIDSLGNFTRDQLLDFNLYMNGYKQISNTELLLLGKDGKQWERQLMKFRFK